MILEREITLIKNYRNTLFFNLKTYKSDMKTEVKIKTVLKETRK